MLPRLTILVSAAGAPGTYTLIKKLKEDVPDIRIIACDMQEEVAAKFIADAYYQVPLAESAQYLPDLCAIFAMEKVDVFFPTSSAEVPKVSREKDFIEQSGVKVLVSDIYGIKMATDKGYLYSILENYVPVPKVCESVTWGQFEILAHHLGYPDKKVCFKPPISKGSRGFRIIDAKVDTKNQMLRKKPGECLSVSMNQVKEWFGDDRFLPQLLLMEYVEGPAYDCMVLAHNGKALLTTVKTREKERWGIITEGELIESPSHVKMCSAIVRELNLSYNVSIQFIGDTLIEVNPRTSTYIYGDDFNEPWLAIQLAMGWITEEEVMAYQDKVPIGRRMVRYMDQIFY